MIKINLLGEAPEVDRGGVIFFASWGGSLALLVAMMFFLSSHMAAERVRLEAEIVTRQQTLKELQEKTKEVKDLQAKQAQLNDKLSVIATLKRSKIGPVRVLDDLNNAIPERGWLTAMVEAAGKFSLKGMAVDDNEVASIMEKLAKSDYFGKVKLIFSQQVDYQEVKIRQFELQAEVQYLGKLQPKKEVKAPS